MNLTVLQYFRKVVFDGIQLAYIFVRFLAGDPDLGQGPAGRAHAQCAAAHREPYLLRVRRAGVCFPHDRFMPAQLRLGGADRQVPG